MRETAHRPPLSNLSPRARKGAGAGGNPPTHRNRSAIERTIAELRRADRLGELDAGALALIRTTAAALDAADGAYEVAMIGRVHITALAGLLAGHLVEKDDELDRFLASLRTAAVGDNPES
jgi:hypothetical protein